MYIGCLNPLCSFSVMPLPAQKKTFSNPQHSPKIKKQIRKLYYDKILKNHTKDSIILVNLK